MWLQLSKFLSNCISFQNGGGCAPLLFLLLVYQQIVIAALLHPKVLLSFSTIPFPETIKLQIRGFFRAQKNSCRTCHYEVKSRKALWLDAREALWYNCGPPKRTESNESIFNLLCKKCELLLRSLRSNKMLKLNSVQTVRQHGRSALRGRGGPVGAVTGRDWAVPWHVDETFAAVMEIQMGFTSQSTFGTGNPRTAWWRQLCLNIGWRFFRKG